MTNTLNKIMHNGTEYDFPEGFTPGNAGTTGQVLTKTADGYEYANAPVTSVNSNTGAVTVSEFTPSGTATTGYVVTKTADGYEWAAPTGGISNVTTGTTTTVSGIWAGSEAEYALITPDASTIYIVFPS